MSDNNEIGSRSKEKPDNAGPPELYFYMRSRNQRNWVLLFVLLAIVLGIFAFSFVHLLQESGGVH